ncbi:hypothetical protein ABNR14_24670, partial [Klebsiella pneumoniae]
ITPSVAEQEGQQTETEATGAPQKHHYTLNQQVGSITLESIVKQTGFNPFDHRDTPRAHATQIGFGQLTRAQQLMGIGYLYVEEQLQTLV